MSDGDQTHRFPASLPAHWAGASCCAASGSSVGDWAFPCARSTFPLPAAIRELESQAQQESDNVEDQFGISYHKQHDSWLEELLESISRCDY